MPTCNVLQPSGDRPRVQLPKRHKSDSLSSANRPLTMYTEVKSRKSLKAIFLAGFIIIQWNSLHQKLWKT